MLCSILSLPADFMCKRERKSTSNAEEGENVKESRKYSREEGSIKTVFQLFPLYFDSNLSWWVTYFVLFITKVPPTPPDEPTKMWVPSSPSSSKA